MPDQITILRDRIIETCLLDVAANGWHWSIVQTAAQKCGIADGTARSVFPNGTADAVAHFSNYTDRKMVKALESVPYCALRTRDRIRAAVLIRFEVLEPHKDIVKQSMAFWALPTHVIQGQRILWRTADLIWTWAGDSATDYTRQTKRASLSSILLGSVMVWINDESERNMITEAFLDRRLENVMEIGRTIGTIKKVVPNLFRQAHRNS